MSRRNHRTPPPFPVAARAAPRDDRGSPSAERERPTSSVVRLGRNEPVATIAGRVAAALTPDVILHAPWGHRQLSDPLNLNRLVHRAESSGKRIAVATTSPRLGTTAREARLPVAMRPGHVRWDAGGRYRFGGVAVRGGLAGWTALAVVVGALLGVGYLVVTLGPRTEVRATVPVEELASPVTLRASASFESVDVEALEVPASRVSRSDVVTLALPAEGRVPVGETPAKVILALANDSTADVLLRQGTVLDGPLGVTFTLDLDTPVPSGGVAVQQMTAAQSGSSGNLVAGALVLVPAHKEVAGVVERVTTLGTDTLVPGVSEGDIARIRSLAQVMETSTTLAKRLLADVPGLVLMDTAELSVRPLGENAQVGTRADTVVVKAEVLVTALAVERWALQELARGVLAAGRPGAVVEDSAAATQLGAVRAMEEDAVSVPVRLSLLFAPGVDPEAMASAVEGKRDADARAVLEQQFGATAVDIDKTPSFWPWLPRTSSRIDVVLTTEAADADEQVAALDEGR